MSSIFTKIINREINVDIVFEDDDIIAFNDINPQAPVHILIVPKKEIKTINDINKEDEILIGKLFTIAKFLAKKFKINQTGYRTLFNCGDDGGQTVFHIHLHLLGGRPLSWPPG